MLYCYRLNYQQYIIWIKIVPPEVSVILKFCLDVYLIGNNDPIMIYYMEVFRSFTGVQK